jgi:hypothetical protein
MKRIVLVAALLLGGAMTAQADTTHWTAVHPQDGDAQLMAAGRSCDLQYGVIPNGYPETATYKKCMRAQGWIYTNTTRDNTWINRRGMRCHPILNGGGSECDSVW